MRSITSLLALSLLTACGSAKVDLPLGDEMDSDGDGLSDADEWDAGSDPDDDDSDGDAWSDGDEWTEGTDPTDADDHPYMGGWPIDKACRDSVAGTGAAQGDIAMDFELPDQFGETVRLYDFCGKAVLLVSAAFWCGSCQAEAPSVQATYEKYKDEGFIAISLMAENNEGGTPSQDDLTTWATTYGLTHPVVADADWTVGNRYEQDYGIPSQHLFAPGMEIVSVDTFISDSDIEAILP